MPTPLGIMMDANAFADWLEDAAPGVRACYFEGELARERTINAEASVLAELAQYCAKVGRVCLTQRKIGEGCFKYFATKCHPPAGSAPARATEEVDA